MDTKKIMKALELIRKQLDKYGIEMSAGCTDEQLAFFLSDFRKQFHYTIDEHYTALMKQMNGVEFNGFTIYPCASNKLITGENIIDANLTWIDGDAAMKNKTVFAESDLDLYIKDINTATFQIVSKYSDDVFDSFDSFDELILYGIDKYFK
jgi:hypothetical protein